MARITLIFSVISATFILILLLIKNVFNSFIVILQSEKRKVLHWLSQHTMQSDEKKLFVSRGIPIRNPCFSKGFQYSYLLSYVISLRVCQKQHQRSKASDVSARFFNPKLLQKIKLLLIQKRFLQQVQQTFPLLSEILGTIDLSPFKCRYNRPFPF